jgi:hypothetical protein
VTEPALAEPVAESHTEAPRPVAAPVHADAPPAVAAPVRPAPAPAVGEPRPAKEPSRRRSIAG